MKTYACQGRSRVLEKKHRLQLRKFIGNNGKENKRTRYIYIKKDILKHLVLIEIFSY